MRHLTAYSLLVIFALILASCESEPSKFEGTWRLSKYETTQKIEDKDREGYEKGIEDLKRRFSLVLNEDHTFTRFGFTNPPEQGKWKTNNAETQLILSPKNAPVNTLAIDTINDKMMIISLETGGFRIIMTMVKKEYFVGN